MASATTSDSIYIFKIWLKYIKPRIWRRVEVPADYSFFDLHVAVQDLFQWSDTHLHQFEMLHRNRDFSEKVLSGNFELDEYIGIPDRAMVDDMKILPEKETKICDHFAMTVNKKKCVYVYDFGAEWEHKITLENIVPVDPNVLYPRCTAGRRQAPPEHGSSDWYIAHESPFLKDDIVFKDPKAVWKDYPFKSL